MDNLYFETDYVKISWDSELQAVFSEWHGYSGGGAGKVQTGYAKICELADQHKSKKWLSDVRKLKVIDPADQDWVTHIGHNSMVKAGIRYVGIVVPQSAIASSSLNRVLNRVGDVDLEFTNHATLEEAKAWLNSKK